MEEWLKRELPNPLSLETRGERAVHGEIPPRGESAAEERQEGPGRKIVFRRAELLRGGIRSITPDGDD